MEMILILIGLVVSGIIGMAIGDLGNKQNGQTGFLLGAVLGPIGWIVTAVIPANAKAEKKPELAPHDSKRIAALEAELAKLKGSKPEPSGKRPVDDDGQIPTYKLD